VAKDFERRKDAGGEGKIINSMCKVYSFLSLSFLTKTYEKVVNHWWLAYLSNSARLPVGHTKAKFHI